MSFIKHVLKNSNEKITSLYGSRTFMMRGKKVSDFHKGIDLIDAKNKSDYVIAFEDGVVISSRDEVKGYDEKKSSGNYVYLNHDNNYQTRYFHMAYGTVMVKEGDRVKKGDILGYTGATGWVTGTHVHFEIKENGINQDPLPYLEGKKQILKDKVYLGKLQVANENVNQITISALNDSLRVRDNPNGNILGFVVDPYSVEKIRELLGRILEEREVLSLVKYKMQEYVVTEKDWESQFQDFTIELNKLIDK